MNIPGRSFFINTPCDDGHKFCFWDSVRNFERKLHRGELDTPHRFSVVAIPGDSLVPRARNNLAYTFLTQTECDYFFPLDSDLDFRPDDILRMADLIAYHDFDVLAGMYAIKQDDLRWCLNALPGIEADKETGLQQIAAAPGGCHIVHRRVFEAMIRTDPDWKAWPVRYTEDHSLREQWDFYFNGVVRDAEEWPDKPLGRYLSEDWGFSYFARKLGFKIWMDTKTVMLHRGECFYPKQARRLTQEEVSRGAISQSDGSAKSFNKSEPV